MTQNQGACQPRGDISELSTEGHFHSALVLNMTEELGLTGMFTDVTIPENQKGGRMYAEMTVKRLANSRDLCENETRKGCTREL